MRELVLFFSVFVCCFEGLKKLLVKFDIFYIFFYLVCSESVCFVLKICKFKVSGREKDVILLCFKMIIMGN